MGGPQPPVAARRSGAEAAGPFLKRQRWKLIIMATHLVNLDAMIPRQDFEVTDEEQFLAIQTLQIRDLEPGSPLDTPIKTLDIPVGGSWLQRWRSASHLRSR